MHFINEQNDIGIYENTKELAVLLSWNLIWAFGLWGGSPIYKISGIFSVLGEICLWAGVCWLLLKNAFGNGHLWKISCFLAFGLLFVIGGMIA